MKAMPGIPQMEESFESCNLKQTASLAIAKSLELKTFAQPKLLAGLACSSRGVEGKWVSAINPSKCSNTRHVATRISLKRPEKKVLDNIAIESNHEAPPCPAATSLQTENVGAVHPFPKESEKPRDRKLTMFQAFAFKQPLEREVQAPPETVQKDIHRAKLPLCRLVSVSSVNSTTPVSASELETKSGMTPRPRSALSKQVPKQFPCTARSSPKPILIKKKWRLTDAISESLARGSERCNEETSPRKRVAFSEQVTVFDFK
jgi:hypothetical protein